MKTDMKSCPRRKFLQRLTWGGALHWAAPSFLAQTFPALSFEAAAQPAQAGPEPDGTILVILQMTGGNDGLNTVVPFANDFYRKARPKLALPASSILKINDACGLHPALSGLMALYDQGQLAVVQGVGYPNPNRSHSRSMEIWQTASDAGTVKQPGWIGRYFDQVCPGCHPTIGIALGRQMPRAFAALHPIGISVTSPQDYRFIKSDRPGRGEQEMSERSFQKLQQPDRAGRASSAPVDGEPGAARYPGLALDYLERVAWDAWVSSERLRDLGARVPNQAPYPSSKLANALRLVARWIGGGLPTRVYHLSQEGYDTHSGQMATHERLLKELGDAVHAFFQDLKAQGRLDRVLLMTFSEFGRRVAENASAGTDHGAASVLFLAGQRVQAGLLGAYPSLAPQDLHRGDLQFTVDFRSVYAGILEHWLQTPSLSILGRPVDPLRVSR